MNVFPDAEVYDSIYGDSCNPGGDRDVITSDPELATQSTKRYPERIGFRPESAEALPVNRGSWEVDSDTDQYGKPRRFVFGDFEDGVDIGALELE